MKWLGLFIIIALAFLVPTGVLAHVPPGTWDYDAYHAMVTWDGVYLASDGQWHPLTGGVVIWSYSGTGNWQRCNLDPKGHCQVKAKIGNMIPWIMLPYDDDAKCWTHAPPSPNGPSNMGVWEGGKPAYYLVRWEGNCIQ